MNGPVGNQLAQIPQTNNVEVGSERMRRAIQRESSHRGGVLAMVINEAELSSDFSRFWQRVSGQSSSLPAWNPYPAQETILQRARAFFRAEEAKDSQSLVASKIEGIRHFDVAGMQRVVAICKYGNSGAVLLASYLDGHDDV